MKTNFILLLLILSIPTSSFANYYLDIYSSYVNAGDAANQIGAGGTVALDVTRDIKALIRSTCTFNISDKTIAGTKYETVYHHFSSYTGIEFTPFIPFLDSLRLKWRNTFLAGFAMTGVKVKAAGEAKTGDSGLSAAFLTGIGWEWKQHYNLFMDIGWHQSFYQNDFKNSKIYGIQAALGVRFALFHSKRISDDY